MAEYEIKLSADTSEATSATKEFRKEYVDLVKAIERPLRQIDAFRKTQESAKAASTAYFEAKKRVDDLKRAIEQAGQPVKGLNREYTKAQQALAAATRQFERQKAQVRDQRAELKAAGVDTRNLAAEQDRLQKSLSSAVSRGQADAGISQLVDRFGITRLRELRAQLVTLQSDYKRLQQAGVLSATERASAEVAYQAQLARTKSAMASLEAGEPEGGEGGIGGLQARMAGLLAAAYTARELSTRFFNVADAVNEVEDRMRNALPVQEDYERAQARLEEISDRVRIPLAAVSESYLGTIGPLRELGFSADAAANMTGALAAGLVADKITGERAAGVLDQLNKGLRTGVIRGDAFNAVIDNSPALTRALAQGLGVTTAELQRMAEAGELTSDKFVTALAKQSDELLRLADNMRVTVGDAQNTFYDKMAKLIGAIDSLTGASAFAVGQIDRLSGSLDLLADGKVTDSITKLGDSWIFRISYVTGWVSSWGAAFKQWKDFAAEMGWSLEEQTSDQEKAREDAYSIGEKRLSEMRAYATNFNGIQENLTKDFKQALADQVAAQTKANSALSKARDEQLKTAKRYKDALEKLRIGAVGPASFGNAQALQTAARSALQQGDFDRAKKNAQAALDMLMKIGEEGGNTYGFAGIIKGLQAIEQEADQKVVDQKQKTRDEARAKTREWKEEFEELKDFKITPTIDDKALADATAKMQKWAKMIGKDITIDPRTLTPAAWHAPLLAPESTTGAQVRPQTQVQVPMALKPAQVSQDPSALPTVEANIKPNEILKEGPASFTNLPAVDADIRPKGVRQDGSSFSNVPVVEADIKPKGVRQDGENSWTNLPPVDVAIRPKAIQQDGDTTTSLPPVDVTMKVDEKAAAIAAETIQAMSAQFRQQMTIPVPVVPVGVASSDAAAPGFAGGGWTGPGSKYMPAGVVHADEHVQPKEVVNEPGALQFLERVRHFGFRNTMLELASKIRGKVPGYADGGLVRGGTLPSIPTPSPAVAAAAEPFAGWDDLGMVTIRDGDSEFPALMRRSTFEDLTHLRARQVGRNSQRKP